DADGDRGDGQEQTQGVHLQVAQGDTQHDQDPNRFIVASTASVVGESMSWTIAPSTRKTTRSAYPAAIGSCATMTTVCPSSSTAERRNARSSALARVSRAPVGSSAKTTSGRPASARAIATRGC